MLPAVVRQLDELERRFLGLESVYDCRCMARADGRVVVYAVPAAAVRPERAAEWIASLKEASGIECDVIPVSRLPLGQDGRVDDAALLKLPLLDQDVAGRWEEALTGCAAVRDAVVTVEWERTEPPAIHYSELFAEFSAAVQDEGQAEADLTRPVPTPDVPAERRPAISHGGELKNGDLLPRLLSDVLVRAAREHAGHGVRTIHADGSERFLSYPELLHAAGRLLSGLRHAGLSPGDRVVLQLCDHQPILKAFWACVLGGFVPVPAAVAPPSQGDKLLHAARMLGARLILTSGELAPQIQALCAGVDLACIEDLEQGDPAGEWHAGDPNDVALVMLTSGSTGASKGVPLTHRNVIHRSAASAELNGFTSEEVTLNWMPLDHVAGIVYFHLRDVFLGCLQVHAATDLVLRDPLAWLEWIDRDRATITFSPNFGIGLVNGRAEELAPRADARARRWDLSCLHHLLNGAEAIVARTARRFLQLLIPYGLPPDAMRPAWGMSETCSGTTYSETFRLESSRDDQGFVEVGRPIPGFSMRIVDDKDQPIAEGAVGRLQVKGETVTAGYYNRPDLTAEAFTPDGWFKTGDLGYLHDGRLTITGREKDVIVINAVNYHCHEIEGVVEEIAGVDKSYTAACAVRDAGAQTDRLAIFFHPETGPAGISAELIKTIRRTVWERLGVSPDYVLPVERESIIKTSIGKIQRTEMAQRFCRGEFVDVVRRMEVLLGAANTLPDWFYRPVWRRAELRGQRETGPVLVFADSSGMGEVLRQRVIAAGEKCVLVSGGGDYRQVMESLERRGFVPASIVYDQTASLEDGLFSVLSLAQALIRQKGARQLLVVSNRQGAPEFVHAPLIGLLKSIPREHPELQCRHVELRSADHEANAALVLRELGGQSQDPEVCWRDGERWVRRLERADLQSQPRNAVPLDKGGIYLLTGGLGGIGLEIASYLLREFQARLILVGRTERLEALQSLEKLSATTGGGVVFAALDVADGGALREAVNAAEERWHGELKGVFHLAGVYRECPLEEETPAGMAAVLRPKLAGTRNLHQLLEAKPGALFVSFSSVNGFFGGHGVSAYAAANAFLESFSEYQRECSGIKAYCLSWSHWDGVGMSRGHVVEGMARAAGFCSISPRQGIASLAAVLQRTPSHVLVGVDGGNPQMRRVTEGLPIGVQALVAAVQGDLREASLPRVIRDRFGVATRCRVVPAPIAAIDQSGRIDRDKLRRGDSEPAAAENELEKRIAAVWSEVLHLERLSVTDNFFDLGGGSLAIVQANRRLQEMLNRRIAMTEMFQYPTVRALAAHLSMQAQAKTPELESCQARGALRRQKALAARGRDGNA